MFKNVFREAKGQATVEYVLLLVLVISLGLALGSPLGRALKSFSGALLGPEGYYACLTQEGVLPKSPRASPCANLIKEAEVSVVSLTKESFSSGPSTKRFKFPESTLGESENFDKRKTKKDFRGKQRGHKATFSPSSKKGDSFAKKPASFPFRSVSSKAESKIRNQKVRTVKSPLSVEESVGDNHFQKQKKTLKKYKMEGSSDSRSNSENFGGFSSLKTKEKRKNVFKTGFSKNQFSEEKDQKFSRILTNQKKTYQEKNKEAFNFYVLIKYLIIIILILVVLVTLFSQIMEYQSRED